MTPTTTRLHLPKDTVGQYPLLSYLESKGLPSSMRWRFHSSGPEFCFEFGLLVQGGAPFEQPDIERSQRYCPDIGHMLRIGSYIYSFLDLQQTSDVCARTDDASLWIIDLKRESIVTRFQDNDIVSERIPIFVQFLNSQGDRFEKCMTPFLELVDRFRKPTKDEAGICNAWTQFEGHIRQTDPKALEEDTSYWQCVIGERLAPYQ